MTTVARIGKARRVLAVITAIGFATTGVRVALYGTSAIWQSTAVIACFLSAASVIDRAWRKSPRRVIVIFTDTRSSKP